jgi:hypothetical protein
MSEPQPIGAQQNAERVAREERLAKALRDNLRRRKEQARARRGTGAALSKKSTGDDGEPPA